MTRRGEGAGAARPAAGDVGRRGRNVAPRSRAGVNEGVLHLLLVCAGGALGSGARYHVSTLLMQLLFR